MLAVLAAALAIWAIAIWITGGGVLTLGPLRLSSRSAMRPGLVALLLAGLAWWASTPAARRAAWSSARERTDRAAPWAAALVALAVAAASAVFGEHVAGGADSSGYLHQSRLWGESRLTLAAPVVDGASWPEAGWTVAPLGFAPAVTPGVLGPAYAPGLPWLMALGAAALGEPGRYLWTPLAAALLVWLTFALARRDTAPTTALAAALLVASSPPVVFASMQTMSDLTCAALWTATLLALGRASTGGAVVAGLCAALALAVRPNLVLVTVLVWSAAVVAGPGTWSARVRRGVVVAVPVALAALVVAWINRTLWGSPFSSGYGATGDLFQAANVVDNLATLWRWTRETQAWWLVLAVPAVGASAAIVARARSWPALALVAAVLLSYLPYAVFAEWWYLRFYLPAWPVLATAACLAVERAASRGSNDAAPLIAVAASLLIAVSAVRDVTAFGVFDLWRSAQRYPAVAAWVEAEAPDTAVVWSVQHSGALAYASTRTVARWDHLAADGLDDRVAGLAAAGRRAWVVLDDWEEADWRLRFAGQHLGRLDWAPLAEARVGTTRVRIYDLTTPTRAVAPALIRVLRGGPWAWARRPSTAAAK